MKPGPTQVFLNMAREPFEGLTGRDVRTAVIDSGVNPANPHISGVATGVAFGSDGRAHDDYLDRLGHGTAVSAAIVEKAPGIQLYAVKVFDRELATGADTLVNAIDWAVHREMRLVNLSLGTSNVKHVGPLQGAIDRAGRSGVVVVAAAEHDGVRWLPGSLSHVVPVTLDWDCPRACYRPWTIAGGVVVFGASGFARPIPGVPPARNLKGISFAVANVSGFVARAMERHPAASVHDIIAIMTTEVGMSTDRSI